MAKTVHLSLIHGAQQAEAPARKEVAREHRYAVMLNGSIRHAKAPNRLPMKVRNISATGLMCECTYPPRLDDTIEVELPRLGPVSGRIKWGTAGRIGIEFDWPIDPTLAWVKADRSEVLFELPKLDPRRPGFKPAH